MAQATSTSTSPPSTDPTQRRFRGCARLEDYELTQKLGEGTFGVVSKGRSRRTGAIVALKKILIHNEKDGFPITALREIKLLKMLSHVNILHLDEMAVERNKKDVKKRATLYMVTPYMDHDLSGMTTNPDIHFTESQIKCYMLQLLEGLRYLHDSNILHRDMKAANILISNRGLLQIADFGLARHYDGPTPQPAMGNGVAVRDYTTLVVTRWYRPPELLLQLRRYTPAIDMWGAGCVFAEMYEGRPILEGKSDLNQAQIIFELVGSPNEASMPGWSQLPGCEGVREWEPHRGNINHRFRSLPTQALSLLKELLRLDWQKRINAIDALQHPYFKTDPLPSRPEHLPRFEESHELDRRKHHERRAALPPAPAGGTVGMGPDEGWTGPGNSNGYANSYDRGRPPRDRGPTNGMPSRHHDARPHQPANDGHSSRRPAWQRGPDSHASRPPSYANGRASRELDYRDRDRDRPGTSGSGRDRDRPDRDYPPRSDQRRTRSRSPNRERRERLQDRERDLYRR
ncbi:kinase-like domain-containing protein [Delphinella strobiligena]|nr:kinase-like domain-containing protein [Delphinella strobiligena]